jgi:hypothetical protein
MPRPRLTTRPASDKARMDENLARPWLARRVFSILYKDRAGRTTQARHLSAVTNEVATGREIVFGKRTRSRS